MKEFKKRGIACDFCGEIKPVTNTSYGTTNYNRVICEACYKSINAYHYRADGIENIIDKRDMKKSNI